MEVKVLREKTHELEIELIGESHTLCNLLVDRLNSNEKVEFAAYKVEHPLVSNPLLYVRVSSSVKPKAPEKKIDLSKVPGVGAKRLEKLKKAGIEYANDLLGADVEELSKKTGIPKKTLEKIVENARNMDFQGASAAREVLIETLQEIKKQFEELKEMV